MSDFSQFNKITPDWVKHAVFYQIFPDRFAWSDQVLKPGNLEPGILPQCSRLQEAAIFWVFMKNWTIWRIWASMPFTLIPSFSQHPITAITPTTITR